MNANERKVAAAMRKDDEAKLLAANLELVSAALGVAEIAVVTGDKDEALHALGLCRRGFSRFIAAQRRGATSEATPRPRPKRKRKRVQAKQRGREMLAILGRAGGPVAAQELATQLGTDASGIRRAASTLDQDLLEVISERGKGTTYELRSLREPAGVER